MVTKIVGYAVDFLIGMVVAAYLLSHTGWGVALYTKMADAPTLTKEMVAQGLHSAIDQGSKMYDSVDGILSKAGKK